MVDFTKLMTPGRSLWYSQLAMDRLVYDEIHMQIDPYYADSFSRTQGAHCRKKASSISASQARAFLPARAESGRSIGRPAMTDNLTNMITPAGARLAIINL